MISKPGAVVARGEMRFRDRHADAVAEALAERPGRHLDARREAALGMPRRDAAPLAELLDLLERKVVAGQMKQAVQQHRAVPGRQHKAIAVGHADSAGWCLRKRVHSTYAIGAAPSGRPGMAAVGLLHGIDRKKAQRIDAHLVNCAR